MPIMSYRSFNRMWKKEFPELHVAQRGEDTYTDCHTLRCKIQALNKSRHKFLRSSQRYLKASKRRFAGNIFLCMKHSVKSTTATMDSQRSVSAYHSMSCFFSLLLTCLKMDPRPAFNFKAIKWVTFTTCPRSPISSLAYVNLPSNT